jgi:hypothetical protein
MSTRSRIGVMHGDIVKSVYCHWDGYLSHNGAILQEHYNSAKANNLVALGDLSSLLPEIGEKHPFSPFDLPEEMRNITHGQFEEKFGNMTTFYGRDRGEENVSWKVAHTFEEFLDQVNSCGGEYYYIMKDGVWYCGDTYESHPTPLTNKLTPLAEALAMETIEA